MTDVIEKMRGRYRYEDGRIFFRERAGGRASIGKEAGWVNSRGYRKVEMDGKTYAVHQVVFAIHHGHIPPVIDHINRDKQDNRIENLRAISNQQNNFNKGAYSHNKSSGVRGVSWHKRNKKWASYITFNGKRKSLGFYNKKEDAEKTRREFEERVVWSGGTDGECHRCQA